MALLHLMHSMGHKLPIVFFREQWQPWKYDFHNRIISEWQLEAYTWHPYRSNFQQSGDEFEVQNYYRLGIDAEKTTQVTCPTGITPMEDGKPWACALEICGRPKQHMLVAKWDMLFMGHKKCDSDPIYGGDAGTRIEARVVPGQATISLPMRDWTHDDVWAYLEHFDVPYDEQRYEKVDGKWGERKDRSFNCDYVHACTACLDRREGAPKVVHCPKFGCTIENVANRVEWDKQKKLSYMED